MKYLPKSRRGGFTLIELLIVIAIIVILVALLTTAVFYAWNTMKRTAGSSDINQLKASLEGFKAKYGVYPPSRIRLCTNYAKYAASPTPAANGGVQLDTESIAFLNRMWPSIGAFSGINWAGNGTVVDEILEGDQCLVFFLGGIPYPVPATNPQTFNDSLGFAKNNPKDPSAVSAASPGQTFYAFQSDRLFILRPGLSTNFASYNDAFAQRVPVPYLYFSANNRKNGYTPGYGITLKDNSGSPPGSGPAVTVSAYFQTAGPPVQWWNPDTFQIICAGANGAYGAGGGPWTPANAETFYSSNNPGNDDQTNFYDAVMGVRR